MLTKNKIPFINENQTIKNAIKVINKKKLGFLVITNSDGITRGVFTDGDLKRLMKKKQYRKSKDKRLMSKNPYAVIKILYVMFFYFKWIKEKLLKLVFIIRWIKKKL